MPLFASVCAMLLLALTLHVCGVCRMYLSTEPSPLLCNYLKPFSLSLSLSLSPSLSLSLSLQLSVSFPDASPQSLSDSSFQRITRKNARQVNFDSIAVLDGGVTEVGLKFSPPPGCHWTEDAPSAWQVLPNSESTSVQDQTLSMSYATP